MGKAIEKYKQGGALKDITDKDTSNVRKNIIDELITHKNSSFYFLENEHEGGGFVLRMREISRVSPEILFKLGKFTVLKIVQPAKAADLTEIQLGKFAVFKL